MFSSKSLIWLLATSVYSSYAAERTPSKQNLTVGMFFNGQTQYLDTPAIDLFSLMSRHYSKMLFLPKNLVDKTINVETVMINYDGTTPIKSTAGVRILPDVSSIA